MNALQRALNTGAGDNSLERDSLERDDHDDKAGTTA